MNMKTICLLLAAVYIAFLVGLASAMVGTITECGGDPVSWAFPVQVFAIISLPFVIGYFANEGE